MQIKSGRIDWPKNTSPNKTSRTEGCKHDGKEPGSLVLLTADKKLGHLERGSEVKRMRVGSATEARRCGA